MKEKEEAPTMAKYLTINQAAKELDLPNWTLRTMHRNGEVPGFYAGSRFYVNIELLLKHLEDKSKASNNCSKNS